MYARTAAFDAAYARSHTPILRADVLENGVVKYRGLPVVGGAVQNDNNASTLRRGPVSIVDRYGIFTPSEAGDLLSPYGREIRVYRGIRSELLPVGTLRITNAISERFGKGALIHLDTFDRSRSVSRARLETPYQIDAGTNYATAIQALLTSRVAGLTFNFPSTTRTTPLIVLLQMADPWAEARKMANSLGWELFFDQMGVCTARPQPDPASLSAAWNYSNSVNFVKLANILGDDPGYNGAVFDSEGPGFAVHSVLYDTNSTSATNSAGSYGKVPEFQRTTLATTQAQADEAVAAMRLKQRGGTQTLRGEIIPHPAMECGDLQHVTDTVLGVNDNYLLETFSLPLTAQPLMPVTLRRRVAA